MRLTFITALAAFAAVLTAGFATPSVAQADCAAPTYVHDDGGVGRGGTISVTGMFWGDDCHDTGPPPPGEGRLGLPLTDLEVVFVQDGTEILVATGNADEFYAFEVDVVVPAELDPGLVSVEVRFEEMVGLDETSGPLRVNRKEPLDSPSDVVEFGPEEQAVPADATPAGGTQAPPPNNPATTPAPSSTVEPPANTEPAASEPTTSTAPLTTEATDSDGGGGSALPWLVGAGVLAALGAGGAVAYRRRHSVS